MKWSWSRLLFLLLLSPVLPRVFCAERTYRIDAEIVHRKHVPVTSAIQGIGDRLQGSLDLGLFGCLPLRVGFKESQPKVCSQTHMHRHEYTHSHTHSHRYTHKHAHRDRHMHTLA